MAEGVGFEPMIRLPVYTLSKRAPSATRPSLLPAAEVANIGTGAGSASRAEGLPGFAGHPAAHRVPPVTL